MPSIQDLSEIKSNFMGYESYSIIEKKNFDVAILLPTYCEAENIARLIEEVENLKIYPLILVIDDSSPDGTAEIVKELQRKYSNIILILRPSKMGLGTAITDGFKFLLSLKRPPKYIVTMDADFSHNPKDILRLINIAKRGYDLVIGSRYCIGGKTERWSPIRVLISKIANIFASIILSAAVRDCTSGFRCYSLRFLRRAIKSLHSQTYEIQIETVRQAIRQGFYITEVPITFINRKSGRSKLTFNEIKHFISYLFKTKLEEYNLIDVCKLAALYYNKFPLTKKMNFNFFNPYLLDQNRKVLC